MRWPDQMEVDQIAGEDPCDPEEVQALAMGGPIATAVAAKSTSRRSVPPSTEGQGQDHREQGNQGG